MASVHLAYDSVLDRRVAVKTLHTELGREQSFRERFRREAQSVAKLNHTNIVSVFDSGEDEIDGALVPFIVMEYVEGKPLRDVLDADIAEHGAMPTEKALKITADVLAALDASHEMGLVHRDIKPGNVMLTGRGVVKVMDFGIARALQSGVTSMTQTGMVVGTPQYLSPEQALGRGVDARSDLYSVGCMLFELLTGRLPFDGDSPLSIAYQHVQEEPPAPSSINRAVPPAVDALVARALRKNPADRFPTAEAMRNEVNRVNSPDRGGNTPLIIGEGPRAHPGAAGQGLSSAIFPQISGELRTPPPDVHMPYTPTAYATPSTPPPGPVVTPQPPMKMAGLPPTPPPTPVPVFAPQPRPQQNNGCSTAMIIVGVVVGVIVLIITIVLIVAMNADSSPDPHPTYSYTGATATSGSASVRAGDPNATGRWSNCTDDYTWSNGTKSIPDFLYKNIKWVRQCAAAGGWKLQEREENETLWGEGMVVDQDPNYDYAKPGSTITVWVSTGHE